MRRTPCLGALPTAPKITPQVISTKNPFRRVPKRARKQAPELFCGVSVYGFFHPKKEFFSCVRRSGGSGNGNSRTIFFAFYVFYLWSFGTVKMMKLLVGVCLVVVLLVGFGKGEAKKTYRGPPRFPDRVADWLRDLECTFCVNFLNNIYLGVEQVIKHKELELFDVIGTQACYRAGLGGGQDLEVCQGIVREFTPDVYYIVFESVLSAEHICSFIDACPPLPEKQWNITFSDTPKPPVKPPKIIDPLGKKYRILHLSDLHFDPDYSPGSNANCDEPVCCRGVNGVGEGEDGAGYWGDYRNCDTPLWTVENMLQNAAKEYDGKIDFILYSGDNPSHVDWETTPQTNSELMQNSYNMIKSYFPDTPFYGTLGNHEPSPLNLFPSDNVYLGDHDEGSIQWLYDEAANVWGDLDEDAQERLKQGGFYAQRVKGQKNLIVVSLNMNFGDPNNWWLLVDSHDPYGMMQWLSDTLQRAEDNGDKVIILGHQPSQGKIKSFEEIYYSLSYRYESTILAHFMGHTHEDEYFTYLDAYNLTRGFAVAFVTGSVTTYSNLNVLYRVYEFDQETHQLVDIYNHVFNLTEANLQPPGTPPNWYLEYTPKKTYGFNGLHGITIQDWADLSVEFETNDQYWNDYAFYQSKSAGVYGSCTGTCRSTGICSIRTTRRNVDFCGNMDAPPTTKERKKWAQRPKHC